MCEDARVTILAELTGTLDVDDANPAAGLLGDVEVTDDGTFWFVVNVDSRAAVAFARRFQRQGVRVTYDRGDGVMLPVRDKELGRVLTISESADSYGDTLTFQLVGERFSPYARANFRARRKVEVHTVSGDIGSEFRAKVFTGWIVSATYDAQTRTLTVTCMDAAALYAAKRAPDYALAPNSGKSRLTIGLELIAVAGIPAGMIDLGGDGGVFDKPVVPGEQYVLDYLRDFWGVLGVTIGFEDGRLCARRYVPDMPPVLELHAGNLLMPVGLEDPGTLDPNVTGVVSVAFSRIEPTGLRSEETSVVTVGPYVMQNGVGAPMSESFRVISEVRTRSSKLGTLAVRTEQEEFGIYALRAAKEIIQPTGDPGEYEIVPSDMPAYEYPDGSTRAEPFEQYRLLSRRVETKTLDGALNVVAERVALWRWGFLRKAIWEGGASEPTIIGSDPVYLNDDGEGVSAWREGIGGSAASDSLHGERPDELIDTAYVLNADGTIATETVTHRFYDVGSPRRDADGAYGYGVDPVEWRSNRQEGNWGGADYDRAWGGLRITTRRYRSLGEDRYEVVERTTGTNEAPRTVTATRLGALPRPERAEPETSAQEVRDEIEDRERIALAGEEIVDVQHNEFVQNRTEAAALAVHLARKASARRLSCAVPVEALVHKLRMIRLNLPAASIDGETFYVQEVGRDYASYREPISAERYSPEIG